MFTTATAYSLYVGLLSALVLTTFFQRRGDFPRAWYLILSLPPMHRTAAAMFANWTINTVFVIATGWHDAWPWFIATDAAAAAVVLYQPAGRPQSLIGALYMGQVIVSGVYATATGRVAEMDYWLVLFSIAVVQLLVLGGWHVGHRVRTAYRGADPRMAVAKSSRGVP